MERILTAMVLLASCPVFAFAQAENAFYTDEEEVAWDEADWNFQQSLLELNGEDARIYLTAGRTDPRFNVHSSRQGVPNWGKGYDPEAARKSNEARVSADYQRPGSWHPCSGNEFAHTQQPGMVKAGTWYWRHPKVLVQRSSTGALCMRTQ